MKRAMIGTWVVSMMVSHAALAREQALVEPPQAEEQGKHDGDGAVSGHHEDRVYLGLSAGFGPEHEGLASSGARAQTTGVESHTSLAIGYQLTPRWMLGGMLSASTLLASNTHPEPDAEALPEELDPSRRDLLFAGPYLHWHPSLDSGWYWEFAAGISQLDTAALSGRYTASGGGAELGVGYEWFRRDGFYVGGLASSRFLVMRGVDDQGDVWWHSHSTAVSLSITAAYN